MWIVELNKNKLIVPHLQLQLQLSHYALTNAIIFVRLFYLCVCSFYLIIFLLFFISYWYMSLPYAYFIIIIIFLSFYRVLRVRIHIK